MRFAGRFLCLLAFGWGVSVVFSAVAADSGNPYALIVSRNVFGLVPPPPPPDPATEGPPPEPPPKITPNGIMDIFGKLQVLFKVAVKPPPGQPQKDESHVMAVGEREDEIEVTKIDQAAGVVSFNNHGAPQEIALVVAASTGPAPATPGAPGAPGTPGSAPGSPLGTPGFRPGGPRNPFQQNPGSPGLGAVPGNPGEMNPNNNLGNGLPFNPAVMNGAMMNPGGNPMQNQNEPLTPEAQILLMEHQRAQLIDQGNSAAAILPPTPLTELHGLGNNVVNEPSNPRAH